ncbi:metallophosphoesterase [Microbacterium phage Floof]|uniref:Metallophosphoesterase n=1 Tax=Microbacterium phage Floof TaxID=2201433 RepID=A0A2Z4Q4V4_9CAUD|nr:metallophosphoesterase [Microbacterium phage Floof]
MTRRQPQTFYTSDLHLGHEKVAAIRGFESTTDHDMALTERWMATVHPGDTVYVLGDLTGGSAWRRALEIIGDMPGRKHLIAGNHDGVHPMHRRTYASHMPDYLRVFDTVAPFLRRRIGGHEVLLSHFPYAEYGEGPHRGGAAASRHNQFRLPNQGRPIIHGHTHQKERSWVLLTDQPEVPHACGLHVGVDAWDLTPAPQEALISILDGWR